MCIRDRNEALGNVTRERDQRKARHDLDLVVKGLTAVEPETALKQGPLAGAIAEREFAQQANLQKVEELRERLRLRREWDADAKKHRSPNFIADVQRIQEKGGSLWEALQRERSYRRRRMHQLEVALRAAAARASAEVEEDEPERREEEELDYPPGTWECSRCRQANFPKEAFCIGYTKGVKCPGTAAEDFRRYVKLPVKVGRSFHPPSRAQRHQHRNAVAKSRQRRTVEDRRQAMAKAAPSEREWACARCGTNNHLSLIHI